MFNDVQPAVIPNGYRPMALCPWLSTGLPIFICSSAHFHFCILSQIIVWWKDIISRKFSWIKNKPESLSKKTQVFEGNIPHHLCIVTEHFNPLINVIDKSTKINNGKQNDISDNGSSMVSVKHKDKQRDDRKKRKEMRKQRFFRMPCNIVIFCNNPHDKRKQERGKENAKITKRWE